MQHIRVFWLGGDKNFINFGDALSPLIVEMIARRPVRYSDLCTCDMLAIGSLLGRAYRAWWRRLVRARIEPIKVWGTGSLSPDDVRRSRHLSFHAVRGNGTRQRLRLPSGVAIGDPGLLLGHLIDGHRIRKDFRWGIVPHVADLRSPAIRTIAANNPAAMVIDLGQSDVKAVIKQIARCSFVVSSSLHGLVAADALGIPNIRLKVGNGLVGGNWKFDDYATSVGRTDLQPLEAADVYELHRLEERARCAGRHTVARVCDTLEHAFDRPLAAPEIFDVRTAIRPAPAALASP